MTDLAVSRPLDILPSGKISGKNAVRQLAGWKKKITNLSSAVPVKFANRRLVKTLFARECKRIREHKYASSCSFFIMMPKKNTFFSSGAATRFLMTFVVVRLPTLKNGAQRPTKLFSALLIFAFFCAQSYGQHRARRTVRSSSAFWYVYCSPRGAFLVEQFYESP